MSEDTITTLDEDSTPSTSRRDMLGKIGAAGTIAWATPVILASPAAAAHESGHVDPPTPVCGTLTAQTANIEFVSPPPSAIDNAYRSDTRIRVWLEKATTTIPAGGQPVTNAAGSTVTLSEGTPVAVYFAHYDRLTNGNGNTVSGSATFSTPILGIAKTAAHLNQTGADAYYSAGTTYPTGSTTRGIETSGGALDTVFIDPSNEVDLNLKGADFDQVRIFVSCV